MLKERSIEILHEQLIKKKQKLLLETSSSKELIDELMDESVTDDLDFAEISIDSYNMNTLCKKQVQEIQEIDISLRKIKNKIYGICEMCDDQIELERLKAKPHARFCVECRSVYEQSLKNK